jgi:hypothetical protein
MKTKAAYLLQDLVQYDEYLESEMKAFNADRW